eukprot:1896123-Amphidinium_carterae.1
MNSRLGSVGEFGCDAHHTSHSVGMGGSSALRHRPHIVTGSRRQHPQVIGVQGLGTRCCAWEPLVHALGGLQDPEEYNMRIPPRQTGTDLILNRTHVLFRLVPFSLSFTVRR